MAWCLLVRQSGCSGKDKINWKCLLRLNSPARNTALNHQAAAAGLISQGTHIPSIMYGSFFNSFLGSSITSNVKLPDPMPNGFSLGRRHFSSGYAGNDDVEARLIREDDNVDHTESIFSTVTGHGYGVENGEYGDYHDEQQSNRWGAQAFGRSDENMDGDDLKNGDDKLNDPDADVTVPSDEEFEAEETDEELEELLAETPLFEPPDFQGDYQSMPEYSFRPEGRMHFPGMEYDPEELDISKPLEPRRRQPREKTSFSVQEVIDKADFRNARFLTMFIGDTGNILARKQFKMRNKSHGRITKAIKTARFFGLVPYTNMGRPRYVFNQPYDEDADFYESDDTVDEEGGTSTNMTEEREQKRYPYPAGTEASREQKRYTYPAGTEARFRQGSPARGSYDGRVGQNTQGSSFSGQGRWQR